MVNELKTISSRLSAFIQSEFNIPQNLLSPFYLLILSVVRVGTFNCKIFASASSKLLFLSLACVCKLCVNLVDDRAEKIFAILQGSEANKTIIVTNHYCFIFSLNNILL